MIGELRFFPEKLNWMTAEEHKEHKDELLREQIHYMYEHSPEFFQVKLQECGAQPGDICSIEDLRKLPVIMDKDVERLSMESSLDKYGHPFGLHVCCDPADIISTGGTSGGSTGSDGSDERDP